MRKWEMATLASLLALSLGVAGCFGSMALTHRVYDWNKSINHKWGQEGVFLAFIILPVYGLSMLGDAIIFNSIEFWGGNNPMASRNQTIQKGKETAKLSTSVDGTQLTIVKYIGGKLDRTLLITRLDAHQLKIDASNGVHQTATLLGDAIQLRDANGKTALVSFEHADLQAAMLQK